MGEWRYSSTFLDLGNTWRWVVNFIPLPLYPLTGEKAPSIHWIGPSVRLDTRIQKTAQCGTSICTPTIHYLDDHLKEHKMGAAFNVHKNRNVYKILVGKLAQKALGRP
jgi:hypothetical protein